MACLLSIQKGNKGSCSGHMKTLDPDTGTLVYGFVGSGEQRSLLGGKRKKAPPSVHDGKQRFLNTALSRIYLDIVFWRC